MSPELTTLIRGGRSGTSNEFRNNCSTFSHVVRHLGGSHEFLRDLSRTQGWNGGVSDGIECLSCYWRGGSIGLTVVGIAMAGARDDLSAP